VVEYVNEIVQNSQIIITRMIKILDINSSTYYEWRNRYTILNKHNGSQPKSHWLTPLEQVAILAFAKAYISSHGYHLQDGYRRITYAGIDQNLFACSPSSVYRLLKKAGLLRSLHVASTCSKGSGYRQPLRPHQEWHIDIKYINYKGTFLFLISIMDGYSRYIVHSELRLSMTEYDVEIVLQRALEKYQGAKPKIISDNGGQFIAKDFKNFIIQVGLEHVKISPSYPQSNGKIERFHRSIQEECVNTTSLLNIEDARMQVQKYIDFYNNERLHSSLNYLRPIDYLQGNVEELLRERQEKMDKATAERNKYWEKEIDVA
jgi:transposase InsO family protein